MATEAPILTDLDMDDDDTGAITVPSTAVKPLVSSLFPTKLTSLSSVMTANAATDDTAAEDAFVDKDGMQVDDAVTATTAAVDDEPAADAVVVVDETERGKDAGSDSTQPPTTEDMQINTTTSADNDATTATTTTAPTTAERPASPALNLDEDDEEEQHALRLRRRRIKTVKETETEHLAETQDDRDAAEKRRERKQALDKQTQQRFARAATAPLQLVTNRDIQRAERRKKAAKEFEMFEKHLTVHPSGVDDYDEKDDFIEHDDDWKAELERQRKAALTRSGGKPVNPFTKAAEAVAVSHVDEEAEKVEHEAIHGVDKDEDDEGEDIEGDDSERSVDDDDDDESGDEGSAGNADSDSGGDATGTAAAAAEQATVAVSAAAKKQKAIVDAHNADSIPCDDLCSMICSVHTQVREAFEEAIDRETPLPDDAVSDFIQKRVRDRNAILNAIIDGAAELIEPIINQISLTDSAFATLIRNTCADHTVQDIQYSVCNDFEPRGTEFGKKPACTLCCSVIDVAEMKQEGKVELPCFKMAIRPGPHRMHQPNVNGGAGVFMLCDYARYYLESLVNLCRLRLTLCAVSIGHIAKEFNASGGTSEELASALDHDTVLLLADFIRANWSMMSGMRMALVGSQQ
jgi:hypothetical protein